MAGKRRTKRQKRAKQQAQARAAAANARQSQPAVTVRTGPIARLRNYFFAGVLVTAPVAITIWATWAFLDFVDARVTPLIPAKWNPETYLPFSVPGIGLVVVLAFLTLVGMLTAGYIGRLLMRQGERLLAQVPVIRSIYSAVKQIFETVLAQRSQAFRQVALVEYPSRGIWAIGFVTTRSEGEVQYRLGGEMKTIFVPATPNPTTGFLLFLPEEDVEILDMTVEQGLKLVVSGGIVVPPKNASRSEAKRLMEAEAALSTAPKKNQTSLATRLRNYLIAGVLVTAPVSITLWLAWQFINFVDSKVTPLIPPQWQPESFLPFGLPGFGVVVVVVGLTLIGMFAAGYVGRLLMRISDWFIARVPVVRSVYAALKQILETVLAQKSEALRECVLFNYPRKDAWSIGFITGKTEGHVQELTASEVINVFLPTTPNPTSGFLLFVPKTEVIHLDMPVEDGLKLVVSGGIVEPAFTWPGQEDQSTGQLTTQAAKRRYLQPTGTKGA